MKAEQAEARLKAGMAQLVQGEGRLCGLTVCYGTANQAVIHSTGLAQEVLLREGQWIKAPLPITENTLYDLASLTKLFTLVCALQLVETGAMALSDSLASLDSRFTHLQDCSLLDCLSYRASLQTPQRVDAQPDADQARAMVFQTRAQKPVGERLYSDMNALVLKFVVEAVSGLPFFDYLSQQVLQPAGMADTFACLPPDRLADAGNYNYEHTILADVYHLHTEVLPGLPHDPKARLLRTEKDPLSGHAGLFSTAGDLCRFCQALLKGQLISLPLLKQIGINRTGYLLHDGSYRQFLGLICFAKSPVQRLSEVPEWMGLRAFGLSGYTGNHLALDPEAGVFDLMLGNRCHNRLSKLIPEEKAQALGLTTDGQGQVRWPDGRQVASSFRFIYQKDAQVHNPVRDCLIARGWLPA